jgi:zinc/manganese transport system permease protein
MERLIQSLPVLVIPFLTCLVIAGLHCYMGLHVLRRGVIFVDLALAQCAALGAAVALFLIPILWPETLEFNGNADTAAVAEVSLADELALEEGDPLSAVATAPEGDASSEGGEQGRHEEEHGRFGYIMSLLFALLGAILLAFGRFRDERVPHEAVIGIVFVVCAALSVLILSKAPHGHDKMEAMLIGSILFVSREQLAAMLVLYLALGFLHFVFRGTIIAISDDVAAAERSGIRVRLWDCFFFTTFAVMVTQSVSVAGVFVVFSYLIIPAACGKLFGNTFMWQLLIGWAVAVVTTIAGLIVSAVWDMPTGSSLVSCFGAALVVCSIMRSFSGRTVQPEQYSS